VCVIIFLATLNIFFKDPVQRTVRDVWSVVSGSSTNVTPSANATPAAPAPPKAKTKQHARPAREEELAKVTEPKETLVPPKTVEVTPQPPPFPSADDLKAGMTREELLARFGQPRFTASWSENGMLAEKFIYSRDARVTAVILRDGEVVTSRTGRHDPWARSAWWQAGTKGRAGVLDGVK